MNLGISWYQLPWILSGYCWLITGLSSRKKVRGVEGCWLCLVTWGSDWSVWDPVLSCQSVPSLSTISTIARSKPAQTLEPHKWGWLPSVVPQPLHRNKAPFLFLLNYNNFVILCWFFLLMKYFLSRFCLPPPPSFFKMLITLSAAWTVSYPKGCAPLLMETNSSSAGRGCVSKHLLSVYGQMLVLCKKTIRKKNPLRFGSEWNLPCEQKGLGRFYTKTCLNLFPPLTYRKINFPDESHGKGSKIKGIVGLWINKNKKV